MFTSRLTLAAMAAGLTLVAQPAAALQIVLHDQGGLAGSQAEAVFKMAAKYWGSVLTNTATVDMDVRFQSAPDGFLGAGGATSVFVQANDIHDRLDLGQTSALDATAVASLADLDGGTDLVLLPMPIHLALGGGAFDFGTLPNSQLTFNSGADWDFDPTDGIAAGRFDLLGAVLHEMGHALGFGSGVDFGALMPLDLFRYAAPGQRATAPGAAYFSLDGGQTAFMGAEFSSPPVDGADSGHWKVNGPLCGPPAALMQAQLCLGQLDAVSGLDLAAMDVIGYKIGVDVANYRMTTADIYRAMTAPPGPTPGAVPEPGAWALMILGFGAAGATLRRRRAAAAA